MFYCNVKARPFPPSVDFFTPGVPAPGGSKKAFKHAVTGKVVVTDDAKNNAGWRQRVALFAAQARGGDPPFDGPLEVFATFTMPRPKWHYGSGKNARRLKPSAPDFPTGRPDTTKLFRAVEDALNGVLWADDAQVVHQDVKKVYGEKPGAAVVVRKIEWAKT